MVPGHSTSRLPIRPSSARYYGAGVAFVQSSSTDMTFMEQPAMPQKHTKPIGVGQSIIIVLEVCVSDFPKGLVKLEQSESDPPV